MPDNNFTGYEAFWKVKKHLLERYYEANELIEKRADLLDRTLLTLSGGAFALSITLVTRPEFPKSYLYILFLSWGAFSLSLIGVVFALKRSQATRDKMLRGMQSKLNNLDSNKQGIVEGKVTVDIETNINVAEGVAISNQFALWGFVVGMILMGTFAVLNLTGTK